MNTSRLRLGLVAFSLILGSFVRLVNADDVSDCVTSKHESRIKICSSVIDNSRFAGGGPSDLKDLVNVYVSRGTAYFERGDTDQAIKDFISAAALSPSASAYRALGQARSSKGDYERAIESFSKAIKLDSKDSESYVGRAAAQFKLDNLELAVGDFNEAISLDPSRTDILEARNFAKKRLDEKIQEEASDHTKKIAKSQDRLQSNEVELGAKVLVENFVGGTLKETGLDRECIAILRKNLDEAKIDYEVHDTTSPYVTPKSPFVDKLMLTNISDMDYMGVGPANIVLKESSVFESPAKFKNFLDSDAFQNLKSESSCFLCDIENTNPTKIVGIAYGGASQIFSSGKAIKNFSDLKGLEGIASLEAWSLVTHAEFEISRSTYAFGRDPVLLESEDQSSRALNRLLLKAREKYADSEYFIVMPTLAARNAIPLSMRNFMATSMSQIEGIMFWGKSLRNVSETGEGSEIDERLKLSVELTTNECSEIAFARELSEIKKLLAEGTKISKVDIGSFRNATLDYLKYKKHAYELEESQNDGSSSELSKNYLEAINIIENWQAQQ